MSGFTQAGVYSRRQFCADLKVCRPPEPLWNPRLREAALPLYAIWGHCVSEKKHKMQKISKLISDIKGGNAENPVKSRRKFLIINVWLNFLALNAAN